MYLTVFFFLLQLILRAPSDYSKIVALRTFLTHEIGHHILYFLRRVDIKVSTTPVIISIYLYYFCIILLLVTCITTQPVQHMYQSLSQLPMGQRKPSSIESIKFDKGISRQSSFTSTFKSTSFT